jgi:Uma2 family endonuclease
MDLLMRLETRPSGREPDLVFIATEHLDRLKDTYLDGPADLAVEVVSPDSDVRDRSEKFREYEGAGIPEYWLLDPIRREALFYRLGDDGRYHLVPIGEDGLFRSVVLPGFTLRIAWLWQRPLPAVTDVMRQVGV